MYVAIRMMATICLRLLAIATFSLPLLTTSFQTNTETILYVKPTSDSPCPAQPCFTLSEYQHSIRLHLTNLTTMRFLPGDHILDNSLTIKNVIKFNLFGHYEQLRGILCRIICRSGVGLSFHNVSSLQITTLAFNNCGKVGSQSQCGPVTSALSVSSVLATLTDITFQGSLGSAVATCKSTAILRGNNSFVGNLVNNNNNYRGIYAYESIITISGNSRFSYHTFSGSGGAISASNSILNITANTVFAKNVAHDGGAIYGNNSTLTFSGNSIFHGNSATNSGGAVYLDSTVIKFNGNSTFHNNSAITGNGRGGALHSKNSILKFYGIADFSNNSALYGGGMSLVSSILKCNRSSMFHRNWAAVCGGGIHARVSLLEYYGSSNFRENTIMIVFNAPLKLYRKQYLKGGGICAEYSCNIFFFGKTSFENNEAVAGGGIYASTSSTISLYGNASFESNRAVSGDGGGIYMSANTNVSMYGTFAFKNNSAHRGAGGGMYGEQFQFLQFAGNGTFKDNMAKNEGGGMSIMDGFSIHLRLLIMFEYNNASNGGGIYTRNCTMNFSTISLFKGNRAKMFGGGVHATRSSVLFQGNHTYTFLENLARDGGAIFADRVSSLDFNSGSIFRNNFAHERGGGVYATSAQFTERAIFEGNSANNGGGLFANDGPLILLDSSFENNSANNGGGGIYVTSQKYLRALYTCVECVFRRNSAYNGGGLYMDQSTVMQFNSTTTFKENAAALNGGGIYVNSGNTVIMHGDCHFANNSAFAGGGIYADIVSNVSLHGDSTFINNSAEQHGGGLCIHDSIVTFTNSSKFKWNSAFAGGGIYVAGGAYTDEFSSVSLHRNSTFMHNSANTTGGAIHADSGTFLRITGISVFGNNSAKKGGGLYLLGFSFNIYNFTFQNNTAVKAGAIYAESCILKFTGYNIFENNFAQNDGGVILTTRSTMIFNGFNIFQNNTAYNGGVIHATRCKNVSFSLNNHFISNLAHSRGGGIYAVSSKLKFADGTLFRGNMAKQGAGVYVQECITVIRKCTFRDNSAEQLGGGICVKSVSTLGFSGYHRFANNSAMYGGAIAAFEGSKITSYSHANGIFEGNSAQHSGGAFSLNCSTIYFRSVTHFQMNSGRDGGAIAAYNSTLNFTGNNTFGSNSATANGGGILAVGSILNLMGMLILSANEADYGGGIFADSTVLVLRGSGVFKDIWSTTDDNSPNINGTILDSNTTGGETCTHTKRSAVNWTSALINNLARYGGGGICATDGSFLNVSGYNTFRCNSAMRGGTLYFKTGAMADFGGHSIFMQNVAKDSGGVLYVCESVITFLGTNIFVSNSAAATGGVIHSKGSVLNLNGIGTFQNNSAATGGVIESCKGSFVNLNGNGTFRNNSAWGGGAIHTASSTLELAGTNIFIFNSAATGGAIESRKGSFVNFNGNGTFRNNSAQYGGAIYTASSSLEAIGMNTFENNIAEIYGGAIYTLSSFLNFSGPNSFTKNVAESQHGGAVYIFVSTVSFHGINFNFNNAVQGHGGGIYAALSKLTLKGFNIISSNSAIKGGGIYAEGITRNMVSMANGRADDVSIKENESDGTEVKSIFTDSADSIVRFNGINTFINNWAVREGGAMWTAYSTVTLKENVSVINSTSYRGGGIYASYSGFNLLGQNCSFINNTAQYGGGLYFTNSSLFFAGCNNRNYSFAPMSQPQRDPNYCFSSTFINNSAIHGGAIFLDHYSQFELSAEGHVYFETNTAAEFGAALYVLDVPGPNECQNVPITLYHSKCFLSVPSSEQYPHMVFEKNTAEMRGNNLYGGMLDRCSYGTDNYTTHYISGLDVFDSTAMDSNKNHRASLISSDQVLCFCSDDPAAAACTNRTHRTIAFRGQTINISIIAIDQTHTGIPTVFQTDLHSDNAGKLKVCQSVQKTTRSCSYRKYTVVSPDPTTQLVLYPSVTCGRSTPLFVNISFLACPPGFELSKFTSECICDTSLQPFTNTCDINTQMIKRTRNFWFGLYYNNGSFEGIIAHHYCPLDYCIVEHTFISPTRPDQLCAFNHSGVLCGECKRGMSITLGSSNCMQCTNWYAFLLIPFAIAGLVLVFFLMVLNITTAVGTISGLIFYANIVAANDAIFFQQQTTKMSIFIAWLNLDLGIKTCFFNGLDIYWKTWLQFLFPLYVWGIVGIVVLVSRLSTKIAGLLTTNAVPLLATLFLLSYAKILRIIITIFSFATIEYPNGETTRVWLYNGNVPYLEGKHIPLFIAGVTFALVSIPYTLFLLFGQCLLAKSDHRLLKWVNKLMPLLDAHQAPYKPKYRYWTGLLLLVRVVLFIVFSVNFHEQPIKNLLATAITTTCLLAVSSQGIYTKWYLNILEVFFLLNLNTVAVATLYEQWLALTEVQSSATEVNSYRLSAIVYTSIGLALVAFIGIVLYHIFQQTAVIWRRKVLPKLLQWKAKLGHSGQLDSTELHTQNQGQAEEKIFPSTTYIEIREPLIEQSI